MKETYLIVLQLYQLSLKMSGVLQDACKDLYDQILQNPDYLTSQNRLVDSFLAKLAKETVIKCHFCSKQIKQNHLISQGKHLYCILCFSQIILQNKQPYLVVNLSKKAQSQSSLNLAQQLRIVNVIRDYGIEHQRVRSIDLMDLSIFKKNLKQSKEAQNMKDHKEKGNQHKKGSILFNQYSTNDFVLAYMHEKTNPQLKSFILQRKYLEEKQKEQMLRDVEKICQSQNDQAQIDEDSDLSIDYERVKIDKNDILKSGKQILKKIRMFTNRNSNRQKRISKIRKLKAIKVNRQTKANLHKDPSTRIKRNKAKACSKK